MADSLKEKREREGAQARAQYEAEVRAAREKTARLRELRLAREAADKTSTGTNSIPTAVKKKRRKKGQESEALSEWLANQRKDGRGS